MMIEPSPYGLFDYSGQTEHPHVVRNANGRVVFRSDDRGAARAEYDRLSKLFIADAAIAAGIQAVPEGWCLVPVEPTWKMMVMSAQTLPQGRLRWSRMLYAAPTPPAPLETGEA
jgi:uncharacterized protein YjeT (DUF2065 family)